ncbi:MAG TPA: hypothetical protein VM510_10685 [Caulifigura sp.]|jgi:hypothetical protein|nr:hypothetical protein [Caulifigura sp.]
MAKSKKQTPKGPDATTWIVRIVLIVVLAAVVVVGLKELGPRQDATASRAAVSGLLANAGEDKGVLKSQVKPLIKGSPKVESVDPKTLNSPLIKTAEKYTWPGMIRSYSMTIGYSLGDDPEVEVVE